MAKSADYIPSQSEVDHILYCEKLVSFDGIKWCQKPPPDRPSMWLQMNIIPFDVDGIPISGLSFLIQWKPDHESKTEIGVSYPKINIIALYNKKRIFAVDTYPFDKHTNRFKIEHPDYKDVIYGPHYHLYCEEAGDYSDKIALPLKEDIQSDDLAGYWNYFCEKLKVTCSERLPIPLEDGSGQLGLDL